MKKIAVSLMFMGLAGCGGKQVSRLQTAHPGGFGALVALAPECRSPIAANLFACEQSARMLEQDPQTATKIFIAGWEHAAFNRPVRNADARAWVSEMNRDPKSGRIVLPAAETSGMPTEAAVASWRKIAVRALNRVYKRAGDRYSMAMMPRLAGVELADITALASFSTSHMLASGGQALAALQPPTPKVVVARDPMHPTGHGPLPLRLSGRWQVVEAGQLLKITLADGSEREGTLAACNAKALLLQTSDGSKVVVATSDLKGLERR